MSMEVLSKLKDIVPNPGCVFEALESILESCETPERVEERTWLGIRLSVCEFQAANVYYPSVCTDQHSISRCTQMLETKPTWWTTFSGNYRHITSICLEYQPHYESRKVLNTFKHASELFAEYQRDIEELLSEYLDTKTDAMRQLQKQNKEVLDDMAQVSNDLVNLRQLIYNSSEIAGGILYPLNAYIDLAESKLNRVVLSSQLLTEQTLEVSRRVDVFNATMVSVELRHANAVDHLENTVNSTMVLLGSEVKSLENALGAFHVVLAALSIAVKLFWPVFVLSLVVGLLLFANRMIRRPKLYEADPNTLDFKYDLLFH